MPVAKGAVRRDFGFVRHQPVAQFFLVACIRVTIESEGLDGRVHLMPGLPQGSRVALPVQERGKVPGSQQAELPPARVQAFSLPGRRGRDHFFEGMDHGKSQALAGRPIRQAGLARAFLLDQPAPRPGMVFQVIQGVKVIQNIPQ